MGTLSDYLKSNLPEYFQKPNSDGSKTPLMSYIDTAGEFLEDIREAINQFGNARDSYRATNFEIDNAISDYGIRLPSNLPIAQKREFMRDISEIIKKGGTGDWLNLILRFVGGRYSVSDAWIYDIDSFNRGFYRNISTGALERVEITNTVYTKFLYGDYAVYPDGVYFDGYTYQDYKKLNKFSQIPILGEKYEINYESYHCVSKTPYVLIRLDSGIDGFNLDIDDYVDSNGVTYSFTVNEKYQIANDLISYFLTNVQRPSTVKIIITVSDAVLGNDDTLSIVDEITFIETIKSYIETVIDEFSVTDSATAKTLITAPVKVGGYMNIGNVETPLSAFSVLYKQFYVGVTSINDYEAENWNAISLNIPYALENSYDIRIRALTGVTFTNTTDGLVNVYGGNILVDGSVQRILLATVEVNGSYAYENTGQYFFIKIEPDTNNGIQTLQLNISTSALNRGL